jgi:hypothetical protein
LLGETVLQEIQSVVTLGFRHTDESRHEARVHEDGFETSDGMYADDGMNCLNWLAARYTMSIGRSRGCLVVACVES